MHFDFGTGHIIPLRFVNIIRMKLNNTGRWYFTVFILLIYGAGLHAGDSTRIELPGKITAKLFCNFHSYINTGNNALAFEIGRAYFGYEHKISENFDACVKLDIGSPEDLSEYSRIRRYAYFKNAYLKFKHANLTSYFGIIDLYHFKLQENFWGRRYIEKSFSDRYRLGNTADLGWMVNYDFKKWLSADFTIMNGEGYSDLQNDNTLKTGAGVTLRPVQDFTFRIYGDYSSKSAEQYTIASFAGYERKDRYSFGLEYNHRFHDDYNSGYDKFGYSVYGSVTVIKKVQLFGRVERLFSNKLPDTEIPWNLGDDGSAVIGGIEYSPVKYVKIALNYQDWYPYAKNETNKQLIYLNMEINF